MGRPERAAAGGRWKPAAPSPGLVWGPHVRPRGPPSEARRRQTPHAALRTHVRAHMRAHGTDAFPPPASARLTPFVQDRAGQGPCERRLSPPELTFTPCFLVAQSCFSKEGCRELQTAQKRARPSAGGPGRTASEAAPPAPLQAPGAPCRPRAAPTGCGRAGRRPEAHFPLLPGDTRFFH